MGNTILVFIFLNGTRESLDILSSRAPKKIGILEIQFVITPISYSDIGSGGNSLMTC